MRKFLSVLIGLIGLSLIAVDVDARRMSGGKSIGKQREAMSPNQTAPRTPQQQQATPNTPPQQQQAAPGTAPQGQQAAPGTPPPQQVAKGPSQQQAAPGTPPVQQPSGASRWLGPLAGLAIGAGLASLFLHNGLGGALAGILLAVALAMGIFFLFRLLTRGRTAAPLRYAGATPNATPGVPPSAPVEPVLGHGRASAAPHSVAATTAASSRWPGFDEEQFVRHARTNFVDLQAAYDASDMAAIRDFLTPELAAEVEKDMAAKGPGDKTDVMTLNAEVLDVATENGTYVVSVRFTGLLREGAGSEPQPFNEIWHLEKPISGRSGWLVSGIQQG
jgi:predicted lipid-binding transport protein (Tim44 family)